MKTSQPEHTPDVGEIQPQARQIREGLVITALHPCQHVDAPVTAKYARFALVFLFVFTIHFTSLGAKNVGPVGVGIFDTLFISANGSFTIKGDLYLEGSDVLGEGSLHLNSDSPQQIVSRNSQVTNLNLTNPGRVTLKGELRITQSLTIKKGTLDAGQADLNLSDSADVKLLAGAKLLMQSQLQASPPLTERMLSRLVFLPDAIIPSVCNLQQLKCSGESVCYKTVVQQTLSLNLDIAAPPPKRIETS